MVYTKQDQLPLQNLSKHAKILHTIHSSLISIDQLCDEECIVAFDKHKVVVTNHYKTIIEGYQDTMGGLWCFPFNDPSQVKH